VKEERSNGRRNRPRHVDCRWQPSLDALREEWTRDARKIYHGSLFTNIGLVHDSPDEIIIIALLPDVDSFHQ